MAKVEKFNLDDYQGNSFELLPEGQYNAKITKSTYKANSKKTGMLLSLQWVIVKGKYKGEVLFSNLNLKHENKNAVRMSLNEFADIHRSMGFKNTVKDTEKLHGKVIKLTVKVKDDRNNITGYEPLIGKSKTSGTDSGMDYWDKGGDKKKKKKKKKKGKK